MGEWGASSISKPRQASGHVIMASWRMKQIAAHLSISGFFLHNKTKISMTTMNTTRCCLVACLR